MIKEIDHSSEAFNSYSSTFLVKGEKDQDYTTEQVLEDLTDTINTIDRPFLCACEIGYPIRAAVIKTEDGILELLNPITSDKSDLKLVREASIRDGKEYLVPRFNTISVQYLDRNSTEKSIKVTDDQAILIGQIISIFNYEDPAIVGLELTEEFEKATTEEQAELINWYFGEHRQEVLYGLGEQLKSDEQTKKYWESHLYNKGVNDGTIETELIEPIMNRKQRRGLGKYIKKLTRGKKK